MAYAQLKQRLDRGEVVILDGPTGTELQRRGVAMDPAAWCGPATLGNDRLLTQIHADYIAAGAEIVTANTFASSRLMLKPAGFADRVDEINRRAVDAARRARDTAANGTRIVVAGSLSHMVPMAPGADVADPRTLPSDGEIGEALDELAQILKSAGCELIILEMMYHPTRTRLALEAARATGLPVWFGLSARRGGDGSVLSFLKTEDVPLEAITRLIPTAGGDATGVDAAGVMHTGAELVEPALSAIRHRFAGPLMAYPDSGYFEMPDWRFVDVVTPARFEEFCRAWIGSGAQIIGGCCGLSVDHIRAAVRARDAAGRVSERRA
jgi:homocysteine S-methyltransferase